MTQSESKKQLSRIEGLLEKLEKSDIVCYGKYDTQPDRMNCEKCDFENDCKKHTDFSRMMNNARSSGLLTTKQVEELKNLLD